MDSEMEPLFGRRKQRTDSGSRPTTFDFLLLGGLMLFILLVSILTSVALPEKFFKISKDNYADVVMDMVIMFNLILASIYIIVGIFNKHYFDLVLSMCSICLAGIYILIDFIYTDAIDDPISVARLVIISLSTPFIFVLIFILTKNYLQNRLLMATKSIIRMYDSLNVIFSLLKLDLQLNITFAFLYFVSDLDNSFKLFYIIFIVIYSIVQYLIGRISLKKEITSALYFHILLFTLSIYFIQFQFFLKAKQSDQKKTLNYFLINQSFLFTCLIELIVRVFAYIQMMNCFRNFDYGLTDDQFVNLAKNNGSLLGRKRTRLMYMQ